MTTIIDEYLDSPMDSDDVFPCKGCGEILEEGKAFELAGNRWHLDCFRCNTCGTLLDSDANLLLLGDGSLICNNCTYSCSACGDKIEDLAILTGDQAFCSTCFRCRNCKRKIENLRYARTSQGIFCMDCHETLMARRRKKSKAAAAAKAREKDHSPMITDKSLPALPPNVIPNNAFSNDRVDPDSDTPTELSPRPRINHRHNESSSRGSSKPARSPERPGKVEGLGLPSHAYRNNRNSAIISNDARVSEEGDSFFIPVALDPSPGPTANSRSTSERGAEPGRKDYFTVPKSSSEKRSDSHSSTPHIAFQEKGRQLSSENDVSQLKQSSRKPSKASPAVDDRPSKGSPSKQTAPSGEDFRLQEAPKNRRVPTSRSTSSESSISPQQDVKTSNGVQRQDQDEFPVKLRSDGKGSNENTPPMQTSQDSRPSGDGSLGSADSDAKATAKSDSNRAIPRKELPLRGANGRLGQPRRPSASEDVSRGGIPESKSADGNYVKPRTAPVPPIIPGQPGAKDDGMSPKVSPKLPRWSSGGDFTLDEDMARILGTDEGSSSILRRVSNAVRHGRTGSVESIHHPPPSRASHTRSISETARGTPSPRWPKTPVLEHSAIEAHDISSPMSVTSVDEPALLKRKLRNSEQRVAELERQFNTEKDLKNLNKKLIEKRKTVSVLDTQTEIMIRQLEVLAGYVERAKETKKPIDPRELEDSAIKEFVQKLERVKLVMSEGIEQLHEERDQIVEEKEQAAADRDRALMEFEQLSSKNAQLADMNNEMTHQLQERFRSQVSNDSKSPNGLGIYGHNKNASSSVNLDTASMTTGPTLIAADEESIVEAGPTVVQVRKGQVKKFNWKKGSKTMAQNVAKGVNRAVVAFQNDRERIQHQGLSTENIGMPYNTTVASMDTPVMQGPNITPHNRQQADRQFGFFTKKNNMPKSMSANAMMAGSDIAMAEAPNVLFGSDLVERVEYERRQIPSVVTRCIEEVELRGMDQEGIYRKTGGNSQVNTIKDGFDRSENYDISDPDLDITAVTSVLKQYFRKLPTPLLTFDIYDQVLESNAVADETERCTHLRKVFGSMPQSHRDCLEFLMFHLHRVAQRERENLMSPKNLAVVFAPTIMRDFSIEREMTDTHAKNLAVQFVIENSHTIFDDSV